MNRRGSRRIFVSQTASSSSYQVKTVFSVLDLLPQKHSSHRQMSPTKLTVRAPCVGSEERQEQHSCPAVIQRTACLLSSLPALLTVCVEDAVVDPP